MPVDSWKEECCPLMEELNILKGAVIKKKALAHYMGKNITNNILVGGEQWNGGK